MSVSTAGWIRALIPSLLIGALATPFNILAADHVVRPAEIQKAIVAQAQERQANLSLVKGFFSSGPAAQALQSVPAVRGLVDRAVPRLDEQELAQLAAKVGKIQRDFEAGSLTNQQLTYIVIALATAVIVLILVET